ncbi:DUF1289 domain-containing protein [Silicimonas algicola]|uniref:Fe-S protein YdhL (DUF1289 family) n=1 Tax=Silicimonas algicola TaxID=1826607 RepID=A0A316G8H8_9RHOB|nr:DUF1289 domain-containing protein [Silicimonas algicola]AZQ67459.1 DUF1289 domain-containing protein [Silicimonas algicola]PWK57148.1 hypothetical protein C8D95_103387 [Silicimonas algicola]
MIETPCVNICVIHAETGLCLGCRRSGDEIAAWSSMSDEWRRNVMEELPSRSAHPGRRGGRSGRMSRAGRGRED